MASEYIKNENSFEVGKIVATKYEGMREIIGLGEKSVNTIDIPERKKEREYNLIDFGKTIFFSEEDKKSIDYKEDLQELYAQISFINNVEKINRKIREENEDFNKEHSYHENENLREDKHFNEVTRILDADVEKKFEEQESYYVNSRGNHSGDYVYSYEEHQELKDRTNEAKRCRLEPYFAEIIENEDSAPVYIGKKGIEGQVIDYRDHHYGNIYYNKRFYKNLDVDLIRSILIRNGRYIDFKDAYNSQTPEVSYADQYLIDIFASRGNEMHDIIETIQNEQYEIITSPYDNNIVVEGCAGSGKTMILLHRLSDITFNEMIDKQNFKIILPNGLLDKESEKLAESLEISDIQRYSTNAFYDSMIKEYQKTDEKLTESKSLILKQFSQNRIKANETLDEDIISKLYRNDSLHQLKKMLDAAMDKPIDKQDCFCYKELEIERVNRASQKLFGFSIYCNESYLNNYNIIKQELNKFKIMCKSISQENVKAKEDSLKKQIETLSSARSFSKSDKKYLSLISEQEFYSSLHQLNLQGKTALTQKGEPSKEDKIYAPAWQFYKNDKTLKTLQKSINNANEFWSFWNKAAAFFNRVERFENFLKGISKREYLLETIECCIEGYKRYLGISAASTYAFELFYEAYLLEFINRELTSREIFISIDEFQDFAETEIALIRRIYPNAVFNMYGDMRQSINPKGMTEPPFSNDSLFRKYSLNQNYRNSREITAYINKNFDTDMRPIGLSGLVKEISFEKLSSIEFFETARCVIIVKNKGIIDALPIMEEKLNVIASENDTFEKSKINVMEVRFAKGLEFEQVYVVTEEMTKEEKYVAFTRALNELYIVNDHSNSKLKDRQPNTISEFERHINQSKEKRNEHILYEDTESEFDVDDEIEAEIERQMAAQDEELSEIYKEYAYDILEEYSEYDDEVK